MLFRFLQQIREIWTNLLPALGRIWGKLVQFKDNTLNLFGNIQHLIDSVKTEVDGFRHFTANPHWKNRVISVPRAIENITSVWDIVHDFVTRTEDIVRLIKDRVQQVQAPEPDDIEAIERLPGKLAKVGEKILGIATLIIDTLQTIEDFISDLQSIVDDIHQLREDLEHLDGIFLPQNKPRRYETTKRRARVSP